MKKTIGLIVICWFIISCNNDYRKFKITDYTKQRIDTLVPNNNKTYVSFVIKVKGYSNDTIKIKQVGYNDLNLIGDIGTIYRRDYYGTENVICIFDPYKATKGKLEIEYDL